MGFDLDKGSSKESENAFNTFFTITIGMEFSGFATELTGLSFFVFYGHHNFETSAGPNNPKLNQKQIFEAKTVEILWKLGLAETPISDRIEL